MGNGKSRLEGGFFLFSLYKLRIASLSGFSARFWTGDGYEYSFDGKGIGGKTVLWFGRGGVDRISTLAGKLGKRGGELRANPSNLGSSGGQPLLYGNVAS